MSRIVSPPSMIGIIGGGQLGKMMALSLIEKGYKIAVLDPDPTCPCSKIANVFICASFSDEEALRQLSNQSEILTYEFENVDVEILQKVSHSDQVPQGYECLRVSQDRYIEKTTVENLGIQTVKFQAFSTLLEFNALTLNYPIIIKTRRFGYDGKGQYYIRNQSEINKLNLSFPYEYIAEEVCTFDTEISIIACGYKDGVEAYEAFENRHRHGILDYTIHPARISKDLQNKAIESTIKLINAFNYKGVLAVEFFVKDNELYFNEFAPRPHNSGHSTINSCDYSQFDSHVLAICGSSILQVQRFKKSMMLNILGQDMDGTIDRLKELSTQSMHIHLYGKTDARVNRKMGHITILADDYESLYEIVEKWGTNR